MSRLDAALRRARQLTLVPTKTTCREAVEVGKMVGARIFWRPGGVVNWMLPELDMAQILED